MRQEKGTGTYNVVVIGAGTAGLVTAAGTAGLGGRVALIEGNLMGGDCLNFGCVPSKALISSARLIQQIREAEKWGLEGQEPHFAFEKVFERMRAQRAKIAPNDSQERFESLGVDVFRGEAHFNSPHEVEVNGQKLRANNFVIATGSRFAVPKIDGIEAVPYFTNETIFDELNEKPESMIVLGGGPIGCELGQALSRLGVKITIVEFGPQILGPEDVDVAEFMQKQLEAEGIEVQHCTEAKRVSMRDGRITLESFHKLGGEEHGAPVQCTGNALLVAVGRCASVGKLNLKAAGVKYSEQGVEVNEYLQTSQPHIYAAGDVIGFPALAATSMDQGRLAAYHAFGEPASGMPELQPIGIYSIPEVSYVGATEVDLTKDSIPYEVGISRYRELARGQIAGDSYGMLKLLVSTEDLRLLGVHIFGTSATELVHIGQAVMGCGGTVEYLVDAVFNYPTFSEAYKVAALDVMNKMRALNQFRA